MITKIVSPSNNTNSHNVDYQSSGKKAMTAPKIVESYLTDEGEIMHILDNGRETLDVAYMAIWGKAKGQINWKAKGENPDGRHRGLK